MLPQFLDVLSSRSNELGCTIRIPRLWDRLVVHRINLDRVLSEPHFDVLRGRVLGLVPVLVQAIGHHPAEGGVPLLWAPILIHDSPHEAVLYANAIGHESNFGTFRRPDGRYDLKLEVTE